MGLEISVTTFGYQRLLCWFFSEVVIWIGFWGILCGLQLFTSLTHPYTNTSTYLCSNWPRYTRHTHTAAAENKPHVFLYALGYAVALSIKIDDVFFQKVVVSQVFKQVYIHHEVVGVVKFNYDVSWMLRRCLDWVARVDLINSWDSSSYSDELALSKHSVHMKSVHWSAFRELTVKVVWEDRVAYRDISATVGSCFA